MPAKKDLYIVYQPDLEVAVNELKKNTMKMDDDPVSGKIVGTEDGTVNVIPIAEKAWLKLKKNGAPNGKKLYLGDIKGTENLRPVVDIMYDNFGVKYGWLGDEMLLWTDPKGLDNKSEYNEFLAELKSLTESDVTSDEKRLGLNLGTAGKVAGFLLLTPLLVGLVFGGKLLVDSFHDKKMLTKQQMIYGVSKLYYNDLDIFMKS